MTRHKSSRSQRQSLPGTAEKSGEQWRRPCFLWKREKERQQSKYCLLWVDKNDSLNFPSCFLSLFSAEWGYVLLDHHRVDALGRTVCLNVRWVVGSLTVNKREKTMVPSTFELVWYHTIPVPYHTPYSCIKWKYSISILELRRYVVGR